MPSTLNYDIYWRNGLLVAPKFLLPSMQVYLGNFKRLILENQDTAFPIINTNEGISLTDFVADSIHFGVTKDYNTHAMYILGNMRNSIVESNYRQDELAFRVAATTGPQETYDAAYQLSMGYLDAFQVIYEAMDPRELIFGWGGDHQHIHIALGGHSENPQVTTLTAELGAIPELLLNVTVRITRNR